MWKSRSAYIVCNIRQKQKNKRKLTLSPEMPKLNNIIWYYKLSSRSLWKFHSTRPRVDFTIVTAHYEHVELAKLAKRKSVCIVWNKLLFQLFNRKYWVFTSSSHHSLMLMVVDLNQYWTLSNWNIVGNKITNIYILINKLMSFFFTNSFPRPLLWKWADSVMLGQSLFSQ